MGIRRLSSFMKDNHISLPIDLTGKKLVIDGYSLCNQLYISLKSANTEYCQFYDQVVQYFQDLKLAGVEAFVVIDGCDNENKKLETRIKRCEQHIERLLRVDSKVLELPSRERALPLMTKVVFIDALRDAASKGNVQFIVSDGEADRDVVSLANYLRCPVTSNDSDFFIFSIEGGYIPICDHNDELVDLKKDQQKGYKYRSFCSEHKLNDPRLRLLLPYVLGNDFHLPKSAPFLGKSFDGSIETLLTQISEIQFENEDSRRYTAEIEAMLQEESTFYEVDPHSFEQLSKSQLRTFNLAVPEWVVDAFKRGQFLSKFMSFLVCCEKKVIQYTMVIEDMKQPSAWEVTRFVLPYIVGALISREESVASSVTLYCREGRSLIGKEIDVADKFCIILGTYTLSTINTAPESERKNIMFRVFRSKKISQLLSGIPEDLQLVVVATRCWFKNIANIKKFEPFHKAFISALVHCLQCCFHQVEPVICNRRHNNKMRRLDRIHYLAKWECMLYLAIAFNQILNHPFRYTSPGRLFSSHVFNKCFLNGFMFSKLNSCGMKMFEIITYEISFATSSAESAGDPEALLLPRDPVADLYYTIPTQNRFGSLLTS